MTIGAYTFLSSSWQELEYPADLWIVHNSKFFDQLSILSYEKLEFNFDLPTNLIIQRENPPDSGDFDFYLYGLEKAMKNLKTDWKVYLPSDEFINDKISTEGLNRFLAYPLKYHQLYGNAHTEIIGAFMEYSYRIHFGNKRQIGDGGPRPPYAGKFQFRGIKNLVERRVLREHHKGYVPMRVPRKTPFEAWHTNCLRSEDIMSRKWKEQMTREINAGIQKTYYNEWLELLEQPFAYENYKKLWPNSYLRVVEPPDIILKNRSRFDQVEFKEEDYSAIGKPIMNSKGD